jgi:hypothetical protein
VDPGSNVVDDGLAKVKNHIITKKKSFTQGTDPIVLPSTQRVQTDGWGDDDLDSAIDEIKVEDMGIEKEPFESQRNMINSSLQPNGTSEPKRNVDSYDRSSPTFLQRIASTSPRTSPVKSHQPIYNSMSASIAKTNSPILTSLTSPVKSSEFGSIPVSIANINNVSKTSERNFQSPQNEKVVSPTSSQTMVHARPPLSHSSNGIGVNRHGGKALSVEKELMLTSPVGFHHSNGVTNNAKPIKSPIVPEQSPTPSTAFLNKRNSSPKLLVSPKTNPGILDQPKFPLDDAYERKGFNDANMSRPLSLDESRSTSPPRNVGKNGDIFGNESVQVEQEWNITGGDTQEHSNLNAFDAIQQPFSPKKVSDTWNWQESREAAEYNQSWNQETLASELGPFTGYDESSQQKYVNQNQSIFNHENYPQEDNYNQNEHFQIGQENEQETMAYHQGEEYVRNLSAEDGYNQSEAVQQEFTHQQFESVQQQKQSDEQYQDLQDYAIESHGNSYHGQNYNQYQYDEQHISEDQAQQYPQNGYFYPETASERQNLIAPQESQEGWNQQTDFTPITQQTSSHNQKDFTLHNFQYSQSEVWNQNEAEQHSLQKRTNSPPHTHVNSVSMERTDFAQSNGQYFHNFTGLGQQENGQHAETSFQHEYQYQDSQSQYQNYQDQNSFNSGYQEQVYQEHQYQDESFRNQYYPYENQNQGHVYYEDPSLYEQHYQQTGQSYEQEHNLPLIERDPNPTSNGLYSADTFAPNNQAGETVVHQPDQHDGTNMQYDAQYQDYYQNQYEENYGYQPQQAPDYQAYDQGQLALHGNLHSSSSDPLGRDRGYSVFAFGFGGELIITYPKRQTLYQTTNNPSLNSIEKVYPGPLIFQKIEKVLFPQVIEECTDAFGKGPVCVDSKPNSQTLLVAIDDLIEKFQNRNEHVLLIMTYFKKVVLVDK